MASGRRQREAVGQRSLGGKWPRPGRPRESDETRANRTRGLARLGSAARRRGRARLGRRARPGDREVARAGRALEDPGRAPDVPLAPRRLRRPPAGGALVLPEAAVVAERPSGRHPAAARRSLPQLRGRAGRGRRHAHARRRRAGRPRLRLRLRAGATTPACTTSVTPIADRCCASRDRTASCRSAPRS